MGQCHEIFTSSIFHTFLRFPFIFDDSILVIWTFSKQLTETFRVYIHGVTDTSNNPWSHSPTTGKQAKNFIFFISVNLTWAYLIFYMCINPTKKLLKTHLNIKKLNGNGNNVSGRRRLVNRWPAIGGDYTVESESKNSPEPILRGWTPWIFEWGRDQKNLFQIRRYFIPISCHGLQRILWQFTYKKISGGHL